MYKGKLWTWIIIALVVCCISWFINLITDYGKNNKTYTIYGGVEDIGLINSLNEVSAGFFKDSVFDAINSMEDADIIISEHSDKIINGYKKYDKFLYTPIITCALNIDSDSSGFDKISENIAALDFFSLLKAFEDNKDYSDIGIATEYLTGKIKIGIPAKISYYYNEIVELFYCALNGNKIPADEEKKQLEEEVTKLLGMCSEYGNIQSCIEKVFSCDKKEIKENASVLYLIPESMAIKDNEHFKFSEETYRKTVWHMVYPNATIVHYYDIYIKEKDNNKIFEILTQKCNFTSSTGIRIKKGKKYSSKYIPSSLNAKN